MGFFLKLRHLYRDLAQLLSRIAGAVERPPVMTYLNKAGTYESALHNSDAGALTEDRVLALIPPINNRLLADRVHCCVSV